MLFPNTLGYELRVTAFGVDVAAVLALFADCILVCFNLLDTLHHS